MRHSSTASRMPSPCVSRHLQEPADASSLRQPSVRQRLQAAVVARPPGPGLRACRGRHPGRRDQNPGVPRQESQQTDSGAGAEGRHVHRRVQRDSVLSRGRLALPAVRPAVPRDHPAVDVLRAVQSRALHCGRAPLDPARGDDGVAAGPATGEAGGRTRRALGHGGIPARTPSAVTPASIRSSISSRP